ncbi:hypothetical protein N7G274_006659 [Stereocaulon virgatum]|uniref:Uncharacterized protein n=1 Tax=Stereocaulon virgatum TaxID=373712 RepID=A0ABR4A6J8_9LECA
MKDVKPEDLLAKAEEQISRLTEETERLIEERDEQTADLEQCKSALFALYPQTQISDDTIQRDLEGIHQSIDSFAYDAMIHVDDDEALYYFCVKQQQRYKRLKGRHRKRLGNFILNADIRAWGPYECSNFYILSVILQWILDEYVFKEEYPHGMTTAQKRTLVEVEDGMRYPSQGKGQPSIDRWRSEALTALTARREYELSLADASKDILTKAMHTLSPWLLDTGTSSKLEGRFQRNILDPAIRFHRNIMTSSNKYTMDPLMVSGEFSPEEMLKKWSLKDADEWKQVKKETEVGRALHCLHPPLLRHPTNGGSPIVIVKPVVVVTHSRRERVSKPHSRANTLLGGKTAPSAAIPLAAGRHQSIHALDEDGSRRLELVESPYHSTSSDTGTTSSNRPYPVSGGRQVVTSAETGPGHPSSLRTPQLSYPAEVSLAELYPSQGSRNVHESETPRRDQYSEWLREDHHGQLPLRNQLNQEGQVGLLAAQQVDPRPYRRGSRDTTGERVTQRRLINNNQNHINTASNSLPNSLANDNRSNLLSGISNLIRRPKQ